MTARYVADEAKALAEWLCRDDETWHHHDRTDNFPCTACWGKASRLLASDVVQPREDAVREALLDVCERVEAKLAIVVRAQSTTRDLGNNGDEWAAGYSGGSSDAVRAVRAALTPCTDRPAADGPRNTGTGSAS